MKAAAGISWFPDIARKLAATSTMRHLLRRGQSSGETTRISKGIPEARVIEFAIYGTPEDVLRQKGFLEDADIEYLIVLICKQHNKEMLIGI
jgi:hypothetical protein